MLACCALAAASCGFEARTGGAGDDTGSMDGMDAPPIAWWDPAYGHRRRLVVTTGAVRPDKGYAGYTVRLAELDPAMLTGLSPSCDDLRVVTLDGETWTELARHVIGCGGTLDLRFALPVDLGDGVTWDAAYLYYGATAAGTPPADGVYLWHDDASVDRTAQYAHGRMDGWLGGGHDDSLAWDAAGYYTYDTGDDSQSSYRRAVDERDVLVEASWFHTGCYTNNMQSAVCARGVIASGTGASEQADHYYCTTRAQNPSCNNTDQGIYDGDVVKTDNEVIALQGNADPPPIVPNQWRKQALAVFGAGPTQLRFWDSDDGWPALAAPPASALQASGADTSDYTQRGFAGIMVVQDIARVRDLVIRRYVEPEPTVAVMDEETR